MQHSIEGYSPCLLNFDFLLKFLIGQVVVLVQRQLEGQTGTYDILGNGKMSHSMTSHSPDLIPALVTFVAPKAAGLLSTEHVAYDQEA